MSRAALITARHLAQLAGPALLLVLPGCVAAVVPVVAGGAIAKRQLDRGRGADPAPRPIAEQAPPVVVVEQAPTPPEPSTPASDTPGPQGWTDFTAFAAARAAPARAGERRLSALLDQATLAREPQRQACRSAPPAVVIDLDPGEHPFDPDDPPRPQPGLAEQLASLRSAGITVMWAASLRVEAAPRVYTVLQATGLDPERTDRLLLLRRAGETKQARRMAAGRDWCIVAIAGDRRSDFDELFDYLVDPAGPMTAALAPNFGQGWFLVPTPIS